MGVIVLDSGAVSAFAAPDRRLRERMIRLSRRHGAPFMVPTTVVIEATTGSGARDANVNRLLRGCEIIVLTEALARRSAALRFACRRGSPTDASVVATAEMKGGGVVLTADLEDLEPLAFHAMRVDVVTIR